MRLCVRALHQPEEPENTAHLELTRILPFGIYRHHKGDYHFLYAIERDATDAGYERYFTRSRILSVTVGPIEHTRLLVGTDRGEKDGWLLPARTNGIEIPRFTLVYKVHTPLVNAWTSSRS